MVVIFNIHSWLVLSRTRQMMEEELGERLELLAKTLASQFSETDTTAVKNFAPIMSESGLFNIFVVDESLRFIANLQEPELVGNTDPTLELEAPEILAAFSGIATSSPLLRAGRYYLKSAYAPVYDSTGIITGVLGVAADARFFKNINSYRNTLLFINALSLVALLVIVITSISITRYALKLERTAARAGTFALLGEMAAALAHDIRNPLATILAATEQLQLRYHAGDDRTFACIREEIDRLNRTLTNYLGIGTGRTAPGTETVDLAELIDHILERLRDEINQRNIQIEKQIAPLPPVPGVRLQLHQMFLNIILNAIQAQPDGGLICITGREETRASQRWVVITITDRGPGIPKENLKKVFEPFFTTREKGSGLGLFVVQRIVELHRGRVKITSAERSGTTVEVQLPV